MIQELEEFRKRFKKECLKRLNDCFLPHTIKPKLKEAAKINYALLLVEEIINKMQEEEARKQEEYYSAEEYARRVTG